MDTFVFDIEGDSINPDKIHCLSIGYTDSEGVARAKTTTNYDDMRQFFLSDYTLIGHNIIKWDAPHIERILDIKIKGRLVDTLPLSWYLYPDNLKHGLGYWGEFFGVPKPPIADWATLSIEEYSHRCEEDTKINLLLWKKIARDLVDIYSSEEEYFKLIDYLMFKMDCAREQERVKWKVDVERVEKGLEKLETLKEEKTYSLKVAMPLVPKKTKAIKPKILYKKDGDLTEAGKKWKLLLQQHTLRQEKGVEFIEYVSKYVPPNPNSHAQIKEWLFSLGWDPQTFNHVKEGRSFRKIPQIKGEESGTLCQSVLDLIEKEPSVEHLAGVSVLSHRISVLKGFLKNQEDGHIKAEIAGITNTFRFKHSIIVNLPKNNTPYSGDIRASLIAPEGYELCGSDMNSLEDRTKQHYMWDFDPEYVTEMMEDGFDPHLSLAVFSGAITQEQSDNHKDKEIDEDQNEIRTLYKMLNYACVYGAGATTISRNSGLSVLKAKDLIKSYWERNWAVKEIANSQDVKNFNGSAWIKNPVSGFWHSLRAEKDKFSTLNQSTGVYCFDMWVKKVREKGYEITAQMHDEITLCVEIGKRKEVEDCLLECINNVNEELSLNRDMGIDTHFGENYAEIH